MYTNIYTFLDGEMCSYITNCDQDGARKICPISCHPDSKTAAQGGGEQGPAKTDAPPDQIALGTTPATPAKGQCLSALFGFEHTV